MLAQPKIAVGHSYRVHRLTTGLQFTEGPAWHPGGYLLFSDVIANRMYRLFPDTGDVEVLVNDSGFIGSDASQLSKMVGSNGIVVDRARNIIFCQHGNHALAYLNVNNELKFLTCLFEGKPFNSPNDLTLKSDGSIYFTDPPYGLKDEVLNPTAFQPIAGVYRFRFGRVDLLHGDLSYPNGICFSPGERYLYVSVASGNDAGVWRFPVQEDGKIGNKTLFIETAADGLYCDSNGCLYLAAEDGIHIHDESGKSVGKIPLQERPTNIAAGPAYSSQLFITAGSSVYLAERLDH
ncbi:MAG: SMP-30/gluconolactonase/LRE family protein [Chitinophagaceae bacterium]|nr:SMP-30/gluconolactonase/LRE family protein [Chitinophagaceae bacterium]